ncbi:cathepsin O [Genypterus blacodes]|uniref:cathepsin O n=1 Tax=Genypterus blacodes TaxID=154954 RepID=UPI003F772E71
MRVTAFIRYSLALTGCLRTVSPVETRFNGSAFDLFIERFGRSYEDDSEESSLRHRCFQDSLKRQADLNSFSADPKSAKYGINQFSDLSQDEFRDLYLRASADGVPPYSGPKPEALPAKFDWRDKAVVAPVQDQRSCGSCWAFSVVEAIQAAHAITSAQLLQLSVQQVLDCSYQNNGCNGGWSTVALDWLNKTRMKLVPESEYPYKAKIGICHFFSPSHEGIALRDFTAFDYSGREEAMKSQLVQHGPLAVIVDSISWQDYLGGIIQYHCSSHQSNHAVLVVGYDATGETPYWIVQNTWGTKWGNKGYVYIKIGGNICGIADEVASVFV